MHATDHTIQHVRAASRNLVRQLGFMNRTLAGTDLSASAVHALIEIGSNHKVTAKQLRQHLMLEKSSISRLIQNLIKRGEVMEQPAPDDARAKILHLTDKGRMTAAAIDRHANNQVQTALNQLEPSEIDQIGRAIERYATALGHKPAKPAPNITIETGYTPGTIGAVIALLSAHVVAHYPFGNAFERRIAHDLSEFTTRLDHPKNQIWRASLNNRIVGSISIDGQDLNQDLNQDNNHLAHLRWFVTDPTIRGTGIGKQLLNQALTFCATQGFDEIQLWTLKGLDAARSLYERTGFTLAAEYSGDQWGGSVTELKFVKRLKD